MVVPILFQYDISSKFKSAPPSELVAWKQKRVLYYRLPRTVHQKQVVALTMHRCDKVPLTKQALTAAALQDHLSRQLSLTHTSHTIPHTHDRLSGCIRCGKNGSNRRSRHRPLPSHPAHTNTRSQQHSQHCTSHPHSSQPHPSHIQSEEYVLDPMPPPLTLAQRIGLHPSHPPLLTELEWGEVKEKSRARNDSALPCPICKDSFRLRHQVLLSCSHVFHKACLQALERYTQKKQCPLCRTEGYQTRVIHEGAHQYKKWAATRIQAVWRGYVVRCWYSKVRDRIPPSHPALRRKHYEKKLTALTEQLLHSCEECEWGVESVIADADTAMATSRKAMRCFDTDNPSPDWTQLRSKAKKQADIDCPICLTPLTHSHSHFSHHNRLLAILSCGHLFHVACIDSFERLSSSTHLGCPLCRSHYQRQLL